MKRFLAFLLLPLLACGQSSVGVTFNTSTLGVSPTGLYLTNSLANPTWVPAYPNSYNVGDSWTAGVIGNTGVSWAPGGTVLPQYRWVNIFNAQNGLRTNNYAIAGMAYGYTTNHQNQLMAQIGCNLTPVWPGGVLTIMGGYNDAVNDFSAPQFRPYLLSAVEATLARALLNGYVTVTAKTYLGVHYTFNTSSSVVNEGFPYGNAFPVGSPFTDPRQILMLTGTNTAYANITNQPNAAVFYEAINSAATPIGAGGTFSVLLNGNPVGWVNSTFPTSYQGTYNGVVLIPNLPPGINTITVTNLTGTNRLTAFGWYNSPAQQFNRSIILLSPGNLSSPNRYTNALTAWDEAVSAGAAAFAGFRISYVDLTSQLSQLDAIQSYEAGGDPDHPSQSGEQRIANLMTHARPSAGEVTRNWSSQPLQQPFVALTDAATVLWATGSGFPEYRASVTLGGNRTLSITGAISGTSGVLEVIQDGTGSRTLALPGSSVVYPGGGSTVTLSTAPGSVDMLSFIYDGTVYRFALGKGS